MLTEDCFIYYTLHANIPDINFKKDTCTRFKKCYTFNGPGSSVVEQWPEEPRVVGSIPILGI